MALSSCIVIVLTMFQDFVRTLKIGEYYGSEKTVRMWARVQPYLTRLRSYVSGVSRYFIAPTGAQVVTTSVRVCSRALTLCLSKS